MGESYTGAGAGGESQGGDGELCMQYHDAPTGHRVAVGTNGMRREQRTRTYTCMYSDANQELE